MWKVTSIETTFHIVDWIPLLFVLVSWIFLNGFWLFNGFFLFHKIEIENKRQIKYFFKK